MGIGKFFNEVANGLEQYNQATQWYKWYGWIMRSIPLFVFIIVVLIAIYCLERFYMHKKVDLANQNIQKIVERSRDENGNNPDNSQIHAELRFIKKQLKELKPPSRIKRPNLPRKDQQKVKLKSVYGKRDSDQITQKNNCSDIFMTQRRSKCD